MDLLPLAEAAPAGGAETFQVAIATLAATVMTVGLIYFGQGYRTGKNQVLGRVADFCGRLSGLPGWAALPLMLSAGSLMVAALGFYWDVSIHIDNGRDPGPLANPSHYLILGGLFGIFSAGWISLVLPKEKPGPAAVQLAPDWQVPVSGLAMIGCASFALLGFPLDDVSHRLFGQDVTLWGPTHLMMLGGAALTLITTLGLLTEARADMKNRGVTITPQKPPLVPEVFTPIARALQTTKAKIIYASGGFLIALSIFQAEFDFGVPQFNLLYHPVLIAGAATIALVTGRLVGGRGTAIGAVVFYCVFRGAMAIWVTPIMGQSVNHFPIFIAEAVIVEAMALAIGTEKLRRFGVACGVAIGTLGVLAEYGWSKLWFPIEWPAHILPEALAYATVVGVAGGLVGAYIAGGLTRNYEVTGTRSGRLIATGGVLTIAAVIVALLPTTVPDASVQMTMRDVEPGPGRSVEITARYRPPEAANDPDWLLATAWQGEDDLHVKPLKKIADGVYRTTEPLPADGSWKSAIRLQRGRDFASVPVFMPADEAIEGATEIPVRPAVTRKLVDDRKILQRERKEDIPGYLWGLAGFVVLMLTALLIGLIGWSLSRIAQTGARERERVTA